MGQCKTIESIEIYRFIRKYISEIPVWEIEEGEYLFHTNIDNDTLYYILEGTVKVENIPYIGKKQIVDIVSKDEFTGAISEIHDTDFQCSGVAETNVKVLVLRKPLMDKLMENDRFAVVFYQKTSRRVHMMYKRILARNLFNQNENMAYFILENSVADRFRYKNIYDICENVGISRRGIYNILYRFEKLGYIEKTESDYKILQKNGLEKSAEHMIFFMQKEKW